MAQKINWLDKIKDKAKEMGPDPVYSPIKGKRTEGSKTLKDSPKPKAKAKPKVKAKAKKDKWYPGKNIKNIASKVKSRFKRKPKSDAKGPGVVSKAKTKVATTLSKKQDTVKTKGGDFDVYKKKSMAGKNFRSEFSKARKAGKKSFMWDGRSYSTKTKDDMKVKGVKGDVATPTKSDGGNIKKYEHGGSVTVSNDSAGAGDVAHTYSHSGYKAGE
jgi:hypothetical protein